MEKGGHPPAFLFGVESESFLSQRGQILKTLPDLQARNEQVTNKKIFSPLTHWEPVALIEKIFLFGTQGVALQIR